jgi:PiT family inorganic phosphate transporter
MVLLISIIVLGLVFDFINGFHDAANSISTIVTTRVLTPFKAVLWAACFNFVAFFISKYIIGEFGIANTVSKTVYEQYITLPIILAGVIGAIIWNLLTWWKGIPSSSSHTLIGGFAGSAIMANGFGAIQGGVILKIAAFIFLAPLVGMIIAFLLSIIVMYAFRHVPNSKATYWFKHLQLLSSALFSIGHGMYDSQKVMGIIAAAMIAAILCISVWAYSRSTTFPTGWLSPALLPSPSAPVGRMAYREDDGTKITKVTRLKVLCLRQRGHHVVSHRIPEDTREHPHTIAGSIMGVGATKRFSP